MTASLDFARMLGAAKAEQILTPAVHAALYNPTFPGFDVDVEAWTPRAYDGWFHPSSQSTWTVRQLYLYLIRPDLFSQERMPITGVLAVTAGKFWHRFLQLLWLSTGHLLQDEVPVCDPDTNRRGHADGMLFNGECLEIKTINEYQINKVTSEEELKGKKYDYWAQTQDYLDCLHIDVMRYFIIVPAYPFPMSEFVVRADKKYQQQRRSEYHRAIEMALKYPSGTILEDMTQDDIPACCAPKTSTAQKCPARMACPIGRMDL